MAEFGQNLHRLHESLHRALAPVIHLTVCLAASRAKRDTRPGRAQLWVVRAH